MALLRGHHNVPLVCSVVLNTFLFLYLTPSPFTVHLQESAKGSEASVSDTNASRDVLSTTRVPQVARRFPVLQSLSCVDYPVPLRRKVQVGGGRYWAWSNYVGGHKVRCNEGITLALHGTYPDLHHLPGILESWRGSGPVSLSLFTPGSDFSRAISRLSYLFTCKAVPVSEVHVHLLIPQGHLPKGNALMSDTWAPSRWKNCSVSPAFGAVIKHTYGSVNSLKYPVGEARNLARDNALTHFVLEGELNIRPSRNLTRRFFGMLEREGFDPGSRRAYVLPAFLVDIKGREVMPKSKGEVIEWVGTRRAEWVGVDCGGKCGRLPWVERWMGSSGRGVGVLEEVRNSGELKTWTPYFIVGGRRGPRWVEGLGPLGMRDRSLQVYGMCLLNYTFAVLDGEAWVWLVKGEERRNKKVRGPGGHFRETAWSWKKSLGHLRDLYGGDVRGVNEECYLSKVSLYG